MAAADFEVDLPALRALSEDLHLVHRDLVILPALVPSRRDAIGAARVSDALDEFATNWTQDYEVLRDDTKFLSDFATAAANAYEACESGLSSTFQSGSAQG